MCARWVCSRARRALTAWSWHGHTRTCDWHGCCLLKGRRPQQRFSKAPLSHPLEGGAVYSVRVSKALATLQHQVAVTLRQQYQGVPILLI